MRQESDKLRHKTPTKQPVKDEWRNLIQRVNAKLLKYQHLLPDEDPCDKFKLNLGVRSKS